MSIAFRNNRNRRHWSVVKWMAVGLPAVLFVSLLLTTPAHSQAAAVTSGGYTTSASVSPTSVSPGATASIAAVISSASASTALVDIEVYNAGGTKVFQQYFDNQAFSRGYPSHLHVALGRPGWAGLRYVHRQARHLHRRLGNLAALEQQRGAVHGGVHHHDDRQTHHDHHPTHHDHHPTHHDNYQTHHDTSSTTSTTIPASSLAPLPAGWPTTLQLGMADSPGGAAAMAASAPFSFRYQYLSGGANTGSGWATWNSNGQFVTYYVAESQAAHIVPVFTYYQLLQSAPGNSQGEPAGDFANLTNTATMTSYYQDLTLFFQRAAAKTPVVLHVEPDLWAYLEQKAQSNNASTVPVQVASTGNSDLSGLPNTAAGFAQAFVRLRNKYAPNVVLAYHFSTWGTGTDILYSKPPNATVKALGVQTGQFYTSLGAKFDIAFTDLTDRDAAFKQYVYGDGGASWYSAADYQRSALYISAFEQTAQKRVVIWQIPFGNTIMRAENNTWDHYQDNKVQWLLDDSTRAHLQAYVAAGVVAFLFGRGADGTSCACDAAGDGVTNPAPINGNNSVSLSADDDGGFFHEMASAYYQTGAIPLP